MPTGLPTLIQIFLLAYIIWSFLEVLMKTRHPYAALPLYLLVLWYVVVFYSVVDYQVYDFTILYRGHSWVNGIGIALFLAGSLMRYSVVKTVRRYDDPDVPVESGLFTVVRYPLFTAYLVQLTGIAVCFGSGGGFAAIIFVAMLLIILKIRYFESTVPYGNEALFTAYRAKVTKRLIPGIW